MQITNNHTYDIWYGIILCHDEQKGNPADRNASDGTALEAKIALKAAQKKAEEESGANASATKRVVRKKVPKKADDGLDDLLSAGLNKPKKKR